jgi:hypothetical protein
MLPLTVVLRGMSFKRPTSIVDVGLLISTGRQIGVLHSTPFTLIIFAILVAIVAYCPSVTIFITRNIHVAFSFNINGWNVCSEARGY